jgi:hypothetical protein
MRRNQLLLSLAAAFVGTSLICWIVMFMAGHDVWTFAGKPDFWRLSGPPYADTRVFAVAFYVQFVLLAVTSVALVTTVIWNTVIIRRREREAA